MKEGARTIRVKSALPKVKDKKSCFRQSFKATAKSFETKKI